MKGINMGSDNTPPPRDMARELAQTLDFITVVVCSISMAFFPLLHMRMGRYGIGYFGLGALLFMVFYAGMTPCPLIYPYMAVWFVAVIFQQFVKDRYAHSRYNGFPIICRVPFLGREGVGRTVEACLLVVVAMACASVDENLAGFFLVGAITLAVNEGMQRADRRMRVISMRDNEILQRRAAEDYRGW